MVNEELWYFVLNGLVSMLIPVFLIGFIWQRGFFFKFLKVKISGGGNILIRAWNITHFVYRVGRVVDGFLVFKHEKNNRRISVQSADFYRAMKVIWIDLDLETNIIIRREGVAGTPFDAEKNENLYIRALMAPQTKNTQNYLIIGGVILLLVLTVIEVGLVYKMYDSVFQLVRQLGEQAAAAAPVVGVIS